MNSSDRTSLAKARITALGPSDIVPRSFVSQSERVQSKIAVNAVRFNNKMSGSCCPIPEDWWPAGPYMELLLGDPFVDFRDVSPSTIAIGGTATIVVEYYDNRTVVSIPVTNGTLTLDTATYRDGRIRIYGTPGSIVLTGDRFTQYYATPNFRVVALIIARTSIDSLTVKDIANLESLTIHLGNNLLKNIVVSDLPALTDLEIPAADNPALESLTVARLPSLTHYNQIGTTFLVSAYNALKSFTITDVPYIQTLNIEGNAALSSVIIGTMIGVTTLKISNTSLSTYSLPTISTLTAVEINNNPLLTSLTVPALSSLQNLRIYTHDLLTSLSVGIMPVLRTFLLYNNYVLLNLSGITFGPKTLFDSLTIRNNNPSISMATIQTFMDTYFSGASPVQNNVSTIDVLRTRNSPLLVLSPTNRTLWNTLETNKLFNIVDYTPP